MSEKQLEYHTVKKQFPPDGEQVYFWCDTCGAEWKTVDGKLVKFVKSENFYALHNGFGGLPGDDQSTISAESGKE